MDKKKYDMSHAADNARTTKVDLGNGNEITVLHFIPYSQKESFAMEFAEYVMQADEELGVCYDGYNAQMIEYYLVAKYYTDIDTEGIEPSAVCDFLCNSSSIDNIMGVVSDDFYFCRNMGYRIIEACKIRFETENGLARVVKNLLNTDVDTNNEETRELIEKLIDMRGALMEKQEDEKVLQFGTKKTANHMKTGGAKINLAKKG